MEGELFGPAGRLECTVPSYLHNKGPMGGAPYTIGPRLGDGPIFKVSVSQLDAKERPGRIFIIRMVAMATIEFSVIQTWLPIKSKGGQLLMKWVTATCTCS